MGILAVQNVLNPGKHDLWEVNSDSEYVEEASVDAATTPARQAGVEMRLKLIHFLQQRI